MRVSIKSRVSNLEAKRPAKQAFLIRVFRTPEERAAFQREYDAMPEHERPGNLLLIHRFSAAHGVTVVSSSGGGEADSH